MSSDLAPSIPPSSEHANATAVAQELLDVADRLEDLAVQRTGLARAARTDWAGPHRLRFDAERANRDAQVAEVVARCRRLARSTR